MHFGVCVWGSVANLGRNTRRATSSVVIEVIVEANPVPNCYQKSILARPRARVSWSASCSLHTLSHGLQVYGVTGNPQFASSFDPVRTVCRNMQIRFEEMHAGTSSDCVRTRALACARACPRMSHRVRMCAHASHFRPSNRGWLRGETRGKKEPLAPLDQVAIRRGCRRVVSCRLRAGEQTRGLLSPFFFVRNRGAPFAGRAGSTPSEKFPKAKTGW